MKDTTPIKADSQDVLAGYIAPGELCRQLHRTRRTIDRWHALGLGPPRVVVQRMIFYRVTDVRAWLERHLQAR